MILRSRVFRVVCPYETKDIGRRLSSDLQYSFQDQQGDVSQSVRAETIYPFKMGKSLTALEGNASLYQVYGVSRISGEGRAEFLRPWGAEFAKEGAGGRGSAGAGGRGSGRAGGRAGLLDLCVKTINPLRGYI